MLNFNYGIDVKKIQLLTFGVFYALLQPAYAQSDNSEIQKLRDEIKELRDIIQQVDVQNKDKVIISDKVLSISAQPVSTELTSKDGANIKLYGYVRGDASYQFEGGNGIFNKINRVDLVENYENRDRLYSTVNASRLGLDIKTSDAQQNVSGKIELDFRGGATNDSIRIRHAYLNYKNWLIGQTTSTFLDTDYNPDMVDFGSPLGIGTKRTPMLRYTDKLDNGTQYFIALEQGHTENKLPALTSKIKYKFANNRGSTSLRGLVQEVKVDGADQKLSWGVALGGNYKILDNLEFNANYSHVKGDSAFILYTNSAYNLDQDKLNLNEFDALAFGLTYQLTPKLQGTIAYGAMLANDSNDFAKKVKLDQDDKQNKKLQQGWVNIFYSPINPISIGVEYIYGERKTFDDKVGKDNRVNTMIKYSF